VRPSPFAVLRLIARSYLVGPAQEDFEGAFRHSAVRGHYTIVGLVPKLIYQIKNPTEAFERTAEEHELKPS